MRCPHFRGVLREEFSALRLRTPTLSVQLYLSSKAPSYFYTNCSSHRGVSTEGERGAAKEKMEVPATTEGEREVEGEKEEVRGKTTADKTEDEEGEISSGSSTPGPVSESHSAVTPRCYMDREGGARMDAQRSR